MITTTAGLVTSVSLAPQARIDYGRVIQDILAGSVDYSWSFAPANVMAQAGMSETLQALVRLGTPVFSGLTVVGSVLLARRPRGAPAAAFLEVLAMLLLPAALWFHHLGVLLPFAAMVWTSAHPIVGAALIAAAVMMVPYLFEPLLAVLGVVIIVGIVGQPLLHRVEVDDATVWPLGGVSAERRQA